MGRLTNSWESLQERLSQSVETVTRSSRIDIVGGGIDEIDPPEDLDEYAEQAKETAIVRANLQRFINDVWEPGYRVEGPDATVQYFEGDIDDRPGSPPEDTPEGGFLSQAAVYAGERYQDFYDFGKESTWQRWVRGTALIEYLKAEKDDPESEIHGFTFIRPETVYLRVENNTNILLEPDEDKLPSDVSESDIDYTPRGEVAAYIQFDDESILGLRRNGFSDRQRVPLSQNDVLKQTLEADIGGDLEDVQRGKGVFGTSIIESISDEISEYNQIKRDRAEAISRKAYGIWTAQFTPETIDLGEKKEIIEWDDDSIKSTEGELEKMGPGDVLTSDAGIDLVKHESDVPDLEATLMHYVKEITSGLPVPLPLAIDFAGDINRDVTSDQREKYEDTISEERQYQEKSWTKALRLVAERKGLPTEGLKLKIQPPKEDNPVKSLSTEEIERMNSYVTALDVAAGPQAGPTSLVDRQDLLDVLDFPYEAGDLEDAVEEVQQMGDEAAQEAWNDIMGIEALARYSEGDEVETPSGPGVIVEIRTEDYEGVDDEEIEASEDNPSYVVGTEDGVEFYRASDLESGEIDVDMDDPEEALYALMDVAHAEDDVEALADGRFSYPQSWKDSDTPARLILLKAWAGMGGTFTGCEREMRGEIASTGRFCGAMKDRVLGGWTGWRDGGS